MKIKKEFRKQGSMLWQKHSMAVRFRYWNPL